MRKRHNARPVLEAETIEVVEAQSQPIDALSTSIEQASRMLSEGLILAAPTPVPITLPLCVSRYIECRGQLTELEWKKKELEAEVLEWAEVLLRNGDLPGQEIPLPGIDARLFITVNKPKRQWLNNDEKVLELIEEIAAENEKAIESNAKRIEALKKHRETIDKDIKRLSSTFAGDALEEVLESYIAEQLGEMPERLGLRFHDGHSSSPAD